MPQRIRVLLVDSPSLFRRCLGIALGRGRRIEIVGDAGSGPEALSEARSLAPDVVVVDPAVPNGGPGLVAELSHQVPGAAVVVLTARARQGTVARMLEHGARGYLEKECDVRDVAQCIERVHAGEVAVASPAAEGLSKDLAASRNAVSRSLTLREIEVVRLAADGRTNGEIAQALCITEHTVKSHLTKILGKLGFANRVQLATYAAQLGLVQAAAPVLLG